MRAQRRVTVKQGEDCTESKDPSTHSSLEHKTSGVSQPAPVCVCGWMRAPPLPPPHHLPVVTHTGASTPRFLEVVSRGGESGEITSAMMHSSGSLTGGGAGKGGGAEEVGPECTNV